VRKLHGVGVPPEPPSMRLAERLSITPNYRHLGASASNHYVNFLNAEPEKLGSFGRLGYLLGHGKNT
jgi:hypothetical protein